MTLRGNDPDMDDTCSQTQRLAGETKRGAERNDLDNLAVKGYATEKVTSAPKDHSVTVLDSAGRAMTQPFLDVIGHS